MIGIWMMEGGRMRGWWDTVMVLVCMFPTGVGRCLVVDPTLMLMFTAMVMLMLDY